MLSHTVQMNAEHVLPKDDTSIPTGEVAPVAMHPAFDFFSAPRTIGSHMPDETGYATTAADVQQMYMCSSSQEIHYPYYNAVHFKDI